MLLRSLRASRVQRVYQELVDDFAKWTPSEAFKAIFHKTVISEIERRLESTRSIRIVEAGCGHGTWAQEIFQTICGADGRVEYLGIDFVAERIQLARERMADRPGATFLVADADTWQPATPSDMVVSIEVVSHVSAAHCREWMAAWRGWLKAGGCVVIIDKDRDTQHARKLHRERLKRRFLPRILRGRPYYYPEHYGDYVQTVKYPSFARIAGDARGLGYCCRALLEEGPFRGFIADSP